MTSPVVADGAASYTPGVSRTVSSTTTFAHAGLKNTNSQSAENETVAASRVYDAFGNVVSSSGSWSSTFGYGAASGYQEDPSGLLLLGHRYLDTVSGRFLTADPMRSGSNWFRYAQGNPVTVTDPSGLKGVDIHVTIVYGDRSDGMILYSGGIGASWLRTIQNSNPGAHISVSVLDEPSGSSWERALDDSDIVVFVGHGAAGKISLSYVESWGGLDAYTYANKRRGNRATQVLVLATCEAIGGATDWSYVGVKVWGASGTLSYSDLSNHDGGSWHIYPCAPEDAAFGRGKPWLREITSGSGELR